MYLFLFLDFTPVTTITWLQPTHNYTTNISTPLTEPELHSPILHLYSISTYSYCMIGCLITFIVALFLSLFPCLKEKRSVDPDLFFPFIRRFMKKGSYSVDTKKAVNAHSEGDLTLKVEDTKSFLSQNEKGAIYKYKNDALEDKNKINCNIP